LARIEQHLLVVGFQYKLIYWDCVIRITGTHDAE